MQLKGPNAGFAACEAAGSGLSASYETESHPKSTNMVERLNEEIRRPAAVVRVIPNEASCLRLVRALAAGTSGANLSGSVVTQTGERRLSAGAGGGDGRGLLEG